MNPARIVSFLPSATEMAYALGLGDQVVGVSHECDFPPDARTKPVVVRCSLPVETMSLREIDSAVAECIGQGGNLYEVDQQAIARLAPTHILTQALCQVCAPSGGEIARALKALPSKPTILWFTPHSIEDVFDNLRELGKATGRSANAEELVTSARVRLQRVTDLTQTASHRRVFCLEWIDPYYCSGHWVPEMVELAGGQDALGRKKTDSVRTKWADIAAWAPEILIVSPCGFGIEKATEQANLLLQQPGWSELPAVRDNCVFAVNANAYFARPGPRLVDGVELLAHLFHPELFDWNGPADAFRAIPTSSAGESKSRIKTCPLCGHAFVCKMGGCWCDDFPPLQPSSAPGAACLCRACLGEAVERVRR
ncbi:MAG TPA: ABC transporter substrate-binding protein [Verrucomicrobiae bacterium]|nr:ABC transporter substrate-binding protein [Verrucomicrobiae bacterium]